MSRVYSRKLKIRTYEKDNLANYIAWMQKVIYFEEVISVKMVWKNTLMKLFRSEKNRGRDLCKSNCTRRNFGDCIGQSQFE
jgi:hypothetical protein